MRHILAGDNIGLIVNKQVNGNFQHILCSNILANDCTVSSATKERSHLFPLYLDDSFDFNQESAAIKGSRRANFSQDFLSELMNVLGYIPAPGKIFYYIYSVLHSPMYRTRYSEFIKSDFPRIPISSDDNLFHQLVIYGEELVALHLMKSSKLDTLITQFVGNGIEHIVDPAHPKYADGKVAINKKGDGFIGVTEAVWNFYIGGYQVCHKWLKDRKGRTLTPEDITHYQRIVVAIQETMRLMQQIDEAIPGFPIE